MRILNIVTRQEESGPHPLPSSILFFASTKRISKDSWSTHWTSGPSRFRTLVEKR